MKSSLLWLLVVVNIVLGVEVCLRVVAGSSLIPQLPRANAQALRQADLLMIPGEIPGGNGEVVYMIDIANERLSAMSYDTANEKLQVMREPVDLARVFRGTAPVRNPR